MRWWIAKEACSAAIAIIISYPTSATLSVKRTDFQLDFQLVNFEQTRTVTIFGHHGIIVKYTMMAKPIRALELHYPMIQFLIKYFIR